MKGYPFEVALSPSGKIKGVVLSDQIKNLDWRAREAKFAEKVSPLVLAEALRKLRSLTG